MAFKISRGPPGGKAEIGKAFSAITDGPGDIFKAEDGGALDAAFVRRPIPVFAIDFETLTEAPVQALQKARRTGWRYVVEHGEGMNIVDLPIGSESDPELLSGTGLAGNLARSARKAARIADDRVDYEPRILDLNLIGDSVLWLHCAGKPAMDRFVSLRGRPHELKPEALIKRMQIAAARKLCAFQNADDEAGG